MGKACISKPQQASCLYLLKIPAMNYVLMDPPVGREGRKGVFVHLWCRNKTEEEFTDENVLFKHLVESAWLLLLNPEREGREVFWCSCVLVSLCAAEKSPGHKHLICKAPLSSWALKKEIFITWSDSMVFTVVFILWSVTLRHGWVALPGTQMCVCVSLPKIFWEKCDGMWAGMLCAAGAPATVPCAHPGNSLLWSSLTKKMEICCNQHVVLSLETCEFLFFFKYQGSGDLELLWNDFAELEQILAFI